MQVFIGVVESGKLLKGTGKLRGNGLPLDWFSVRHTYVSICRAFQEIYATCLRPENPQSFLVKY